MSTTIKTSEYLDEMKAGFEQAINKVKSLVGSVDSEMLNQPEAPGKWSMLQCIEHMSLASQLYNENITAKLNNGQLQPAKATYKGHWKGRIFAKMNAPKPDGEIPMKLKTFKFMEPPVTLDGEQVINQFYSVHQTMIALIDESRAVNIDRVKVATALGNMVKLRLGEAYRFLLAHTQRHVVQLERIKNTVNA